MATWSASENDDEKAEWDEWGSETSVARVFRSPFFCLARSRDRLSLPPAPCLVYGPVHCRAPSAPPFAHHLFSTLDASTRTCHDLVGILSRFRPHAHACAPHSRVCFENAMTFPSCAGCFLGKRPCYVAMFVSTYIHTTSLYIKESAPCYFHRCKR